MQINDNQILELGLNVIHTEIQALKDMASRLDQNFMKACKLLLACTGRIIVIGMGKSGHIGKKLAATLASTGSPAFFVHPAEASHGDLGMITLNDVIIALSNSGETEEILKILPRIKRLDIPVVSLSKPQSTLAKIADVNLDVSVETEACSLGLVPTASTTATLVMGDAIAVALLQIRGFTANDFALSHPGGPLGKRLILKVSDIMHTGDNIPTVHMNAPLSQTLLEMSKKRLGMTIIVDPNKTHKIVGIFTDGDLRRAIDKGIDIHNTTIGNIMSPVFQYAKQDLLAIEAFKILQNHKITALPILNDNDHLVGALNIHDLFRLGVV